MELELYLPWLSPTLIPLAVLLAYPLDSLRTLLQLPQHSYVALPSPPTPDYHIALRPPTIRSLVAQSGGLRALYRGLLPALVGHSALLYTGVRLVEGASEEMEAAADGGTDDPEDALSPNPQAMREGQDPDVAFPLSLLDRLAWWTWPYSPSAVAGVVGVYLGLYYPLQTVSLHMRASGFEGAHVSAQPIGGGGGYVGGYHLEVVRGVGREAGVGEVVRRVVEREGWGGLWRGLRWSMWKMGVMGVVVSAVSLATTQWEDDEGDG